MMKASTRDTAQSPPDLISDPNLKQFSMALLLELSPHADHTLFAFPRTPIQLMVDSVTLLMIGDAVTGRVPRFPESVTQIFEAFEFSLPFELKSMTVNLPCDPTSIIAGMKPGFFFEANAFLAGCGFETQSRTNFNPDMGIAVFIASHAADADSAGPRAVSTHSSRQTGRQH